MKKHRVSTTISAKHWELLRKYTGKLETQQKALEAALECMDNNSKQIRTLSPEDELLLHGIRDLKITIPVHKDLFRLLMKYTDIERIEDEVKILNPGKYYTTWYFQKPLKKCYLEEILDSMIFFFKSGNVADSVNYINEGDHYSLRIIHSLEMNYSKLFNTMIESLFDEYGARTESEIADNSIFINIYKN